MIKGFTDSFFTRLTGIISKPLGKNYLPLFGKIERLTGEEYVKLLEGHHELTLKMFTRLMTWVVYLLLLGTVLIIIRSIAAIEFLWVIPAVVMLFIGVFIMYLLWVELSRMSLLSMTIIENRKEYLKKELVHLKMAANTARRQVRTDFNRSGKIDETRWDIKHCYDCHSPLEMSATTCPTCKAKQKPLLPN